MSSRRSIYLCNIKMYIMESLEKLREGNVEFYAYISQKVSSDLPVFYNPRMEFNRNFSVCAANVLCRKRKNVNICDALSASGIMGLRYICEVENVTEVFFCDKNPEAINLISRNLELNGFKFVKNEHGKRIFEKNGKGAIVIKENALRMLSTNIFTGVDLDPYGTPAPFLDSVARATYWKGFAFITATDTAALTGSSPNACLRKYGIFSSRVCFSKELGARILLSAVIKAFVIHGKAFLPRAVLYHEHFYRVFGEVLPRESEITKLVKRFEIISYCEKCKRWFEEPREKCSCNEKTKTIGPLYTGSIFDKGFLNELYIELEKRCFENEKRVCKTMLEEAEITTPFYYNLHEFCSALKINPPKIERVIENLKALGFKASRTHFDALGIKTNADWHAFKEILLSTE